VLVDSKNAKVIAVTDLRKPGTLEDLRR